MKVIRGYEHDFQAIQEMHEKSPLRLDVLVERFRTEMGHVVADPKKLQLNFRLLVARLFGADAASRLTGLAGGSQHPER